MSCSMYIGRLSHCYERHRPYCLRGRIIVVVVVVAMLIRHTQYNVDPGVEEG